MSDEVIRLVLKGIALEFLEENDLAKSEHYFYSVDFPKEVYDVDLEPDKVVKVTIEYVNKVE